MASSQEYLQKIKAQIREITVDELKRSLDSPGPPVLIDVREADEFEQGHVPGALFVPRGFLELRIENITTDRSQPIALICAGGMRSAFSAKSLNEMGYSEVYSVAGGFKAWKDRGLEVKIPQTLSSDQMKRYSRHVLIPEVGIEGQMKLLEAKVLLIGAGGLGSPSAYYLAAAGVGNIGIVDDDTVDVSNLQRQIIHTTDRVGVPKVESAMETIHGLNPDVEVTPYKLRITSENVMDIVANYDVVIDGCDNFGTRYLVNDACVLLNKPNIYASIYRFEGQATTFIPHDGPCYRCLYPDPTPPELAPSCQEAGVLGVLPGVMGLIQATEAVKIILGTGGLLVNRLLTYDALTMKFREMKIRRDSHCQVCGTHPTITRPVDMDITCAVPQPAHS